MVWPSPITAAAGSPEFGTPSVTIGTVCWKRVKQGPGSPIPPTVTSEMPSKKERWTVRVVVTSFRCPVGSARPRESRSASSPTYTFFSVRPPRFVIVNCTPAIDPYCASAQVYASWCTASPSGACVSPFGYP